MLARHAGGKYAYCQNYFVQSVPEDCDVVACKDVLDPAVLTGLVDRFSAAHPGAERRAVVSLWTLYYFSMLTIGSTVAALELKRQLPVGLQDARLCISRKTGQPCGFLLRELGPAVDENDLSTPLCHMLRDHIEPVVAAIASTFGVSQRLVWTNAAGYFNWIIDEIGGNAPERAAACRALREKIMPDGGPNPFCGHTRSCLDDCGVACARRKVCCLRYMIPGVEGCGSTCPLPEGRQAARH